MPYCKNCGEEIDFDVKVCPWCGAKVGEDDYLEDYDSRRFFDDEEEYDDDDYYDDEDDEDDVVEYSDDDIDEDYFDDEDDEEGNQIDR